MKNKPKSKSSKSKPSHNGFAPHFKRKKEIKFDPSKRREYLLGFSKRKRERRAFGLAMQARKDRMEKLENRAMIRSAREDEVSRKLEMHKENEEEEEGSEDDEDEDEEEAEENEEMEKEKDEPNDTKTPSQPQPQRPKASSKDVIAHHDDDKTLLQFGGHVTVTTSYGLPQYDSDEEANKEAILAHRLAQRQALQKSSNSKNKEIKGKQKYGTMDQEQIQAGSVNHFFQSMCKSNLPSTKHNNQNQKRQNTQKKSGHVADMGQVGYKEAKQVLAKAKGKKKKKMGGKKKGLKKGQRRGRR